MRLRTAFAATLVCLSLAGCFSSAPPRPVVVYPVVMTDFEHFSEFPATVSTYQRGRVVAYADQLKDFSVAYNRHDALVQAAVTVYLYDCQADVQQQLSLERDQILQAHPGGSVVSSTQERVRVGGVERTAHRIRFEFDEVFAGKRQPLASELLLSNEKGHCVKVRTSAPVAQRVAAEDGTRVLLRGISPAR